MKRIVSLFLSIIMMLSMFAGCSSKGNFKFEDEKQPQAGTETGVELTRGQWIELLANNYGMTECADDTQVFKDVDKSSPYFNCVQACYEWEILDADSEFKPDETATVDFAIITGIKSIGLDKIANSIGGKQLTDDKSIIDYYSSKAVVGAGNLTSDVAISILNNIDEINTSLKFEQYQDVSYQPGVVQAEPYNIAFAADGVTATLKSISANVGDTIVVNPCPEAPYGYYAKITEKNGDTIKYTQPEFEDIFENIVVKGTYEPGVMAVIPASEDIAIETTDGTKLTPQAFFNPSTGETNTMYSLSNMTYSGDISNAYTNTADQYTFGDLVFDIKDKRIKGAGSELKVYGRVVLEDIVANVDFDISWGQLKSADVSIDSKVHLTGGVEGKIGRTIPLGVVLLPIFPGVTIEAAVNLNVSTEGEITVDFAVGTTVGVNYRKGSSPRLYKDISTPTLDLVVRAKAYIRPQLIANLLAGPFSVVDFKIYTGVEGEAKSSIGAAASDLGCTDLLMHVPLVISIDPEKDSIAGKLGATKRWIIWGPDSSPLRFIYHVEGMTIVPECTATEKDEEPVDLDEAFSDIEQVIDDELLEYTMNSTQNISIATTTVSMNVGDTDTIAVTNIPSGYTNNDIIFESSNPECIQVDSRGNITAVAPGAATIWVGTSDGLCCVACTVIAWDDVTVEFVPLSPVTGVTWEDV